MQERKILGAVLHSREAYETLAPLLPDEELSGPGQLIFALIREYYENDGSAASVDKDVLTELISNRHKRHAEKLVPVVEGLSAVSPANVVKVFLEHKRAVTGEKLGQKLLSGGADAQDFEAYVKYRDATEDFLSKEEGTGVYVATDAREIMQHFERGNLVALHPPALNERVGGGVPDGTHILIFAPPEVGKTATSINMACGFAHDGHKTLYIGNEDPDKMMLMRILCRMAKMDRQEVEQDPDTAYQRAMHNGYGNIVFASLAPGTIGDVRKLIRKHKPRCVVLDQLHNLYAKNMQKVEKLEWLATQAREIGKDTGCIIVSLTQGAESAQGKRVLDMGDVYYSNVAIQQAVDIMIGIGMTKEDEKSGHRTLSLPKNKITGDHEPVPVFLEAGLSRVS